MSEKERRKSKSASAKGSGGDKKLPYGWVEKYSDKKEKAYWKNSESGETSWTFPVGVCDDKDRKSKDKDKDKDKDKKSKDKDKDKDNEKKSKDKDKKSKDREKEKGMEQSESDSKPSKSKDKDKDREKKSKDKDKNKNSKVKPSSDWIEKFSVKKDKPYWKNTITDETTWTNPIEVRESAPVKEESRGRKVEKLEKSKNKDEGKDSKKSAGGAAKRRNSSSSRSRSLSYGSSRSRSRSRSYSDDSRDWSRSRSSYSSRSYSDDSRSRGSISEGSFFSDDEEENEWEEKYSEKKKRPYWKNLRTQETSWKAPPSPVPKARKVPAKEKEKVTGKSSSASRRDFPRGGRDRYRDSDRDRNRDREEKWKSKDSKDIKTKDSMEEARDASNAVDKEDLVDETFKPAHTHSHHADKDPSIAVSAAALLFQKTATSDDEISVATPDSLRGHELPAGWELRVSKTKGKHYYVNKSLQLSQWHFPQEKADADSSAKTVDIDIKEEKMANGAVSRGSRNVVPPAGEPEERSPLPKNFGIDRDEMRKSVISSKNFWQQQASQAKDDDKEKEMKREKEKPLVNREVMNQRKSVLINLSSGMGAGIPLGGAMPPGYLNKRKSLILEAEAKAKVDTEAEPVVVATKELDDDKDKGDIVNNRWSDGSLPSVGSMDTEMLDQAYEAFDAEAESEGGSTKWTGDFLGSDADDVAELSKSSLVLNTGVGGRLRAVTEERLSIMALENDDMPVVAVQAAVSPPVVAPVSVSAPVPVSAPVASLLQSPLPSPNPPDARPPAGQPVEKRMSLPPGPPPGAVPPGPPAGSVPAPRALPPGPPVGSVPAPRALPRAPSSAPSVAVPSPRALPAPPGPRPPPPR